MKVHCKIQIVFTRLTITYSQAVHLIASYRTTTVSIDTYTIQVTLCQSVQILYYRTQIVASSVSMKYVHVSSCITCLSGLCSSCITIDYIFPFHQTGRIPRAFILILANNPINSSLLAHQACKNLYSSLLDFFITFTGFVYINSIWL